MVTLRNIKPFSAHPVPTDPKEERNWNARQWREVSLQLQQMQARLDFVTTNYTFGGHGSLRITADVAVPDLTDTWVRLKPWQVKGSELYVLTSVPNGTHDILVAGTWQIMFALDVVHNELNQARNMRLRLINATTNVPLTGEAVRISVPRDTPETRWVGVGLYDFTGVNGTDPIALDISADVGDTFTGVSYTQGNWSVANIGPWLGELPSGGGVFKR
jgi:hypothetical protein